MSFARQAIDSKLKSIKFGKENQRFDKEIFSNSIAYSISEYQCKQINLRRSFLNNLSQTFYHSCTTNTSDQEICQAFVIELFQDLETVFVLDCINLYEMGSREQYIAHNYAKFVWTINPVPQHRLQCESVTAENIYRDYDRKRETFNILMQRLSKYTRISEWGTEKEIRKCQLLTSIEKLRWGPWVFESVEKWNAPLVKSLSSFFLTAMGNVHMEVYDAETQYDVTRLNNPFHNLYYGRFKALFQWELEILEKGVHYENGCFERFLNI